MNRTSLYRKSWAMLAMLLVSNGNMGCNHKPAESHSSTSPSKISVVAARPEHKTIHRSFTQPGQVEAFDVARLYAKVPAYVEKYLVDIGDDVRGPRYDDGGLLVERGQVLAELSAPELEQELEQKRALVTQASADIEQAQAAVVVAESAVTTAESQLRAAEAAIQRADAEYQRWESEYKRIVQLVSKSAVTQKLADETKAQLMAAEATQAEIDAKIESARSAVAASKAQLEKSKADEVSVRARRQVAKAEEARIVALNQYLKIEAPFDGSISERNADLGNIAQSTGDARNLPLYVVVRTDRVRVFVDLPEMEAPRVQLGDRAQVRIRSLSGRVVEGTVTRTAWVLDPNARTLHAEVDVANPEKLLRPGMYAEVSIELEESKSPCVVPATAVVMQQNQPWCFVVVDGKAVRKSLKVGISSGAETEIVSGLADDDLVIAKAASLSDGQLVELSEPSPSK